MLHAKTTDEDWNQLGTSNSDADHAVWHAHNNRWGLGPIETCSSGSMLTMLHAKTTDEDWNEIGTSKSGTIQAVLHAKTTDEGWNP